MSMLTSLISAAIFIWAISLLGGFFSFHLRKKFTVEHPIIYLAESFAGGIFLGAALFHMLPDAQNALQTVYPSLHFPVANLICAMGFCVLLSLQKITEYYKSTLALNNNLTPVLLTVMISVHAFSEGIALGISQQIASLVIIFIAIIVHKSSEGFAVGLQLQRGTLTFTKMLGAFLFFAFMTPVGILSGLLAHHAVTGKTSDVLMGVFSAFAAGTFLYIATLHKLHHHHTQKKTRLQLAELFLTLLGLALMAIVSVWL